MCVRRSAVVERTVPTDPHHPQHPSTHTYKPTPKHTRTGPPELEVGLRRQRVQGVEVRQPCVRVGGEGRLGVVVHRVHQHLGFIVLVWVLVWIGWAWCQGRYDVLCSHCVCAHVCTHIHVIERTHPHVLGAGVEPFPRRRDHRVGRVCFFSVFKSASGRGDTPVHRIINSICSPSRLSHPPPTQPTRVFLLSSRATHPRGRRATRPN